MLGFRDEEGRNECGELPTTGKPARYIQSRSPDHRITLRASSWWGYLKHSTSRPESSPSAGRRSDRARPPASSSDGFGLSPARTVAGSHAAAHALRWAAATVLIGLPLLTMLATGAQAQTVAEITASISAPTDAEETDFGMRRKDFVVSLSRASSADVTARVCYSGTATQQKKGSKSASDDYLTNLGGRNYTSQCKNLVINAGATSSSIWYRIYIHGDTTAEPDETVIATLSLVNPPAGVVLGTATATYTILDDDNITPTVSNTIPNQTATVGEVFSYPFPANTFSDENGDSLTYTATKSDDSALPSWLVFTPGTLTFSGTPQAANIGTVSVKVTADDGNGGTVSDTFDIVVSEITASISAPTDAEETDFGMRRKDFVVSLSRASSADVTARVCYSGTATQQKKGSKSASDDYLTNLGGRNYTSQCKNLVINAGATSSSIWYRIYIHGDTTAEPDETVIATLSLVNPPAGVVLGTATATYTILDDDNITPTVSNTIPNQTATVGEVFSYPFPANTFSDENGDSLTYTATKSDDSALPSWLVFTPGTLTFSGTPQAANIGTVSVKVTADDGNGGTVSDTFDIVVSEITASISAPTDAEETDFGMRRKDFVVSLSRASSADVTARVCYSGTATQQKKGSKSASDDYLTNLGGRNYTSQCKNLVINAGATSSSIWYRIYIHGDTTAEPDETVIATLSLVNPPAGVVLGTATATYTILDDDNITPTVSNTIPNQTATVGEVFSYPFPANTFSDENGDSLTYTATKSDDSALPSWLVFTPGTLTFSGTPQAANIGTVSVKVTADDGNGGTVSDTFDIVVSEITASISAPTDAEETDFGMRRKDFVVSLSRASSADVTARVCYSGTATQQKKGSKSASDDYLTNLGGRNYTSQCKNLVINAGATSSSIWYRIYIHGDTTAEPDETVIATLSLVNPPAGVVLGTATATYTILDDDNITPTVSNTIPNQTATVGEVFSYPFPANTFSDENGDSLTYTATKSDDSALPSWLVFTPGTLTFSGTPQAANIGTVSVKVTADDGNGGTVSDTFDIVVSEITASISAPTDAEETDFGMRRKDFVVSLSRASSADVTARVCYSGTATQQKKGSKSASDDYLTNLGGRNYTSQCKNLVINAGATSSSIWYRIYIHGDTTAEPDETVIATLSLVNPPAGVVLGTATATYTILDDDNITPTVSNTIPNQTATVGEVFSYPFPANTFSDENGDSLTYTATKSDDSALPSWLVFTPGTLTFSGTPQAANIGTVSVKVTADDGNGGTVSDTFDIVVSEITASISAPTDAEETDFGMRRKDFVVSLSRASSADVTARVCYSGTATQQKKGSKSASDDYLTNLGGRNYTSQCKNLVINAGATSSSIWYRIYIHGDTTAEPDETVIATLSLVNPPAGVVLGTATATYTILDDDNITPTVSNTIPNQTATVGEVFSYPFPANTFSDENGDSLTYTATKSDDSALPSWLVFTPGTLTFSGTPQAANIGTVSVKVTADDGNGGTVSDTFDIVVSAPDNTAPRVTSITRHSPSSSPTNADSLTWRVTFDEVVQNVDAGDFQVSNTTALLRVSQVSDTNAYDVTASDGNLAGLNDTVTLSFNSGHNIQDRAGNKLDASLRPTGTNHPSYVVDNTAPSVAISGLSGTIPGAVTATFTFSEPVTDFASSDIRVTGSPMSNFAVVTPGRIWSARITPRVNGTEVTINVPVNAAEDEAGNGSTAATARENYIVRLSAPVGFTASPGDGQVSLSWSAPTDSANSAAVTKYQYRYQAESSSTPIEWKDVEDGADAGSDLSDETAWTVTGLTNGTRYAFELRAVNAAGYGAVATATATPASSDTTAPHVTSITRHCQRFNALSSDGTACDLSSQGINSLSSGDFNGLSNLQYLYLDGNNLTSLPADVFAGLSNLQELDLSENNLTSLPKDIFTGLSNLQELWLDNANLSSLPAEVFAGLSNLQYLYLDRNSLISLPADVFAGLSNLQELDLNENNLTSLPEDIFTGLSNLQELWLDRNSLINLPADVFAGLSNLQYLYLDRNSLISLPADVFAGLSNLQELYLQGNGLICLPRIPQSVTSNDSDSYEIDVDLGMPSCTGLVLSSSALTVPEAGRAIYTVQLATEPTDAVTVTVSGMGSGVRVDTDGDRKGRQARLTFTTSNWQTEQAVTVRARADDNVISEEVTLIHTAAGGDYDSVTAELGVTVTDNGNDRDNICQRFNALSAGGTICNLSGQGIKSLSSGDFNGLSNLEDLYLDNNRLSSLPADVFAGLSNLQYLDLYSNNLSNLPANIFADLSNLQNLDLYSNKLSSLPANVFAGLSNLQDLFLDRNGLICLPRIPQSVTTIDVDLSTPSCPGLVLSSSALTVPEAGRATYTVQLATEPTDAVTVTVSGMGSGVRVDTDGDRKGRQARLTFTPSNWQTEQAVTVRARADHNAISEEVTLTHTAAGGDYDSVMAELGITATDDDLALALSVDDARVKEGPNAWLIFTLRLSRMAGEPVTVNYDTRDVTATDGEDYSGGRGTLRFGPRELEKQVRLQVHDDHHDEGEETMELVLSEALSARIDDGVGVGTILNSDPMPRAWLTRFGRTVSQHVVDALQGRFAAKPQTGLSLTVAGEALSSTTPLAENQQVLAKALGFETVTAHQLVDGSSFSFSPAADGAPAQFAIWGKGTLSSFSGTEDSVSLAGDVTTALVGADWSTERWRAGAALSHSWGSGSYGEDNNNDADISTTLTGVFPYGRYGLTPRLGIWAVAGYGWGDLSLKPDGDGTDYSPSTTMVMTAVGMDGVLLDGGTEGLSLTSTADALLVKTTSEAVDGLASSDANITRLRLGLEATRPVPLANGASLLPSLELGIRHDSGDAETGFGMELAAGMAWRDPERGISAALKGRTLLTHSDEAFQEQGLAISFAWETNPTNRGPSFSASHTIGAVAEGGMDALLSPTALEALDATPSRHHQFETKLAYGFPAFNDRLTLTPGVGLALSPDSRTYSLLSALAPYAQQSPQATPWELSLEGERQEDSTATSSAEHSLGLRFSLLF